MPASEPDGAYHVDLHKFRERILSFKLPDDWQISDKQNHIFYKNKSYEIFRTDIHVDEDVEFVISVFSWNIPLDHEIYTEYKKAIKNTTLSNLIKAISNYNVYFGIKREHAKKQPFVI